MPQIKAALETDIEDLLPLFMAYLHFYRRHHATETDAKRFLIERLKLHDSQIYIAYMGAEAAAFTQLYPIFSSVQMKRMWLLNDLFVKPTYRQQGLAQALIAHVKAQCDQDYAGILLETEKTNTQANPLYLKEGFRLVENNFYFWQKEF